VEGIARGQVGLWQRYPDVSQKAAVSLHDDGEFFMLNVDVEDWNDIGVQLKGGYHTLRCRVARTIGIGVFTNSQSATTYPYNCTIIAEKVQGVIAAPDGSNGGTGIHLQGTGHTVIADTVKDVDAYCVRARDGGLGDPNNGHTIYLARGENWGRADSTNSAVSLYSSVTNTDVVQAHGVNCAAGQIVKFDGGTSNTGCTIGRVSKGSNCTSTLIGTGESWAVLEPPGGRAALTYSASITPTLARWQTITATNTTAFTINAPTAPGTYQSQELVIEIVNSSGGVLGAVTWNAAYIFPTGSFTAPANGKKRFVRFEWNGSNWIATALATSDY
jgi:hypothetical protein